MGKKYRHYFSVTTLNPCYGRKLCGSTFDLLITECSKIVFVKIADVSHNLPAKFIRVYKSLPIKFPVASDGAEAPGFQAAHPTTLKEYLQVFAGSGNRSLFPWQSPFLRAYKNPHSAVCRSSLC